MNDANSHKISLLIIFFAALLGLMIWAPSGAPKAAPILLFNGTGVSPNDVKAIAAVLKDSHLKYALVTSPQLNGLSEAQLKEYRLIIVPGGNYLKIGESLTPEAARNIHDAVKGGLNYLGICAGGLLAGNASSNSPNLTEGVKVGFYAAVNHGVHKTVVAVSGSDGSVIEHYWEDGPQFTGWGAVVGKYPDGTPAIVEGTSGKGWVILCGVHPEAPESWRSRMAFTTPTKVANACAATLIDAALHGTSLSHF